LNTHEKYMYRCLELAQKGAGLVAPNPMVGSVLVFEDTIIGEGYHASFGNAHAEVNCINSVSEENEHLIPKSTLYVSLEPCAHFGKTPPCANFIVEHQIRKVVIGCKDVFAKVNGAGIAILQNTGVQVTLNVLEKECLKLNKRFFTFHQLQRPYIVLKWAETANGFIGKSNERILITNEFSNRKVHQWRTQEAAILVGTKTALLDNPQLTNRLAVGNHPIRLVIDKHLQIPETAHVFNSVAKTVVFNFSYNHQKQHIRWYQLNAHTPLIPQILEACFQLNIQSILIEGGAKTIQSFIDANLWDEARVIKSNRSADNADVVAPIIAAAQLVDSYSIESDDIYIYKPQY